MSNLMVLLVKVHIPMLLEIKLARLKVEASKYLHKALLADAMVLPTVLTLLQFQLLLMPSIGALINQESSLTVEAALTMPSFLLVLLVETGRSRTLGELDGEKVDSSDWVLETLVEFAHMQVLSLNDRLD